jgi:hypothetical protein
MMKKNKNTTHNTVHIAGRGLVVRQLPPSARGRFAVPCPSDSPEGMPLAERSLPSIRDPDNMYQPMAVMQV